MEGLGFQGLQGLRVWSVLGHEAYCLGAMSAVFRASGLQGFAMGFGF